MCTYSFREFTVPPPKAALFRSAAISSQALADCTPLGVKHPSASREGQFGRPKKLQTKLQLGQSLQILQMLFAHQVAVQDPAPSWGAAEALPSSKPAKPTLSRARSMWILLWGLELFVNGRGKGSKARLLMRTASFLEGFQSFPGHI